MTPKSFAPQTKPLECTDGDLLAWDALQIDQFDALRSFCATSANHGAAGGRSDQQPISLLVWLVSTSSYHPLRTTQEG
ncbi:hypothetical protein GJ744_008719 [Endocarpon pusillum]|uniref:Uncharacterized protein n=1 Tax=Endocarpon pusillum TaxID=364733 RepID=A0A8H7E4A0_9EURO|nr:hypothetical protein GJ744_008719 [Endocarpon pusillum]